MRKRNNNFYEDRNMNDIRRTYDNKSFSFRLLDKPSWLQFQFVL